MAKMIVLLSLAGVLSAVLAQDGRQEITRGGPYETAQVHNGHDTAARAIAAFADRRRRPYHRYPGHRGEHGHHRGGHHHHGALPGRSQTGHSGLHGLVQSALSSVQFKPFGEAGRGAAPNHHHDQLMSSLRNSLRRRHHQMASRGHNPSQGHGHGQGRLSHHHRRQPDVRTAYVGNAHARRPGRRSGLAAESGRLGFEPLGHRQRGQVHHRGYGFRGHGRGGRGRGHSHGAVMGFGGNRHGVGHRGGYGLGPRYNLVV